jgi:hypothetical protein
LSKEAANVGIERGGRRENVSTQQQQVNEAANTISYSPIDPSSNNNPFLQTSNQNLPGDDFSNTDTELIL